jgi:type VI secretion system protein ImpG
MPLRTVFDTEILPLHLDRFVHADKGNGAVLTLGLNITGDGHLGELNMRSLRLHLAGNPVITQALYLALMRNLRTVHLRLLDTDAKPLLNESGKYVALKIDPTQVKPVGFAEDEALTPHPVTTLYGTNIYLDADGNLDQSPESGTDLDRVMNCTNRPEENMTCIPC